MNSQLTVTETNLGDSPSFNWTWTDGEDRLLGDDVMIDPVTGHRVAPVGLSCPLPVLGSYLDLSVAPLAEDGDSNSSPGVSGLLPMKSLLVPEATLSRPGAVPVTSETLYIEGEVMENSQVLLSNDPNLFSVAGNVDAEDFIEPVLESNNKLRTRDGASLDKSVANLSALSDGVEDIERRKCQCTDGSGLCCDGCMYGSPVPLAKKMRVLSEEPLSPEVEVNTLVLTPTLIPSGFLPKLDPVKIAANDAGKKKGGGSKRNKKGGLSDSMSPQKCMFCEQVLSTKYNLHRHYRTRHKDRHCAQCIVSPSSTTSTSSNKNQSRHRKSTGASSSKMSKSAVTIAQAGEIKRWESEMRLRFGIHRDCYVVLKQMLPKDVERECRSKMVTSRVLDAMAITSSEGNADLAVVQPGAPAVTTAGNKTSVYNSEFDAIDLELPFNEFLFDTPSPISFSELMIGANVMASTLINSGSSGGCQKKVEESPRATPKRRLFAGRSPVIGLAESPRGTAKEGFGCEVCARWFATKKGLVNHRRTVHNEKLAPRLQCDKCGRKYSLLTFYKAHILSCGMNPEVREDEGKENADVGKMPSVELEVPTNSRNVFEAFNNYNTEEEVARVITDFLNNQVEEKSSAEVTESNDKSQLVEEICDETGVGSNEISSQDTSLMKRRPRRHSSLSSSGYYYWMQNGYHPLRTNGESSSAMNSSPSGRTPEKRRNGRNASLLSSPRDVPGTPESKSDSFAEEEDAGALERLRSEEEESKRCLRDRNLEAGFYSWLDGGMCEMDKSFGSIRDGDDNRVVASPGKKSVQTEPSEESAGMKSGHAIPGKRARNVEENDEAEGSENLPTVKRRRGRPPGSLNRKTKKTVAIHLAKLGSSISNRRYSTKNEDDDSKILRSRLSTALFSKPRSSPKAKVTTYSIKRPHRKSSIEVNYLEDESSSECDGDDKEKVVLEKIVRGTCKGNTRMKKETDTEEIGEGLEEIGKVFENLKRVPLNGDAEARVNEDTPAQQFCGNDRQSNADDENTGPTIASGDVKTEPANLSPDSPICYVCKFCKHMAQSPSAIQFHEATRHGHFALQCPLCMCAAGWQESDIRLHLESHFIDRPDESPWTKKTMDKLVVAVLKRLPVRRVDRYGVYFCWGCHKAFRSLKMQNVHEIDEIRLKQHKCNVCCMRFAEKEPLDAHVSDVHAKKGVVYSCLFCMKISLTPSELKAHQSQNVCKKFKKEDSPAESPPLEKPEEDVLSTKLDPENSSSSLEMRMGKKGKPVTSSPIRRELMARKLGNVLTRNSRKRLDEELSEARTVELPKCPVESVTCESRSVSPDDNSTNCRENLLPSSSAELQPQTLPKTTESEAEVEVESNCEKIKLQVPASPTSDVETESLLSLPLSDVVQINPTEEEELSLFGSMGIEDDYVDVVGHVVDELIADTAKSKTVKQPLQSCSQKENTRVCQSAAVVGNSVSASDSHASATGKKHTNCYSVLV